MSSETQNHPWHMVAPSHWPFVGSIGALVAALGGIWYMQDGPIWGLVAGLAIVVVTMFGWWGQVIREAQVEKAHSGPVQHGLRLSVILFIVSEVMFFFAFFWAYFNASVPALSEVASTTWPPEGIEPLHTWGLPFINTLILLTSGATVTWAHHALKAGHRRQLKIGLFLTVALGTIFLGTQAYEYTQATFGFTDGIYPSTFYLATGFHGFHVFIGTIFLLVCYIRSLKGDFTPEQHIGFEAAAWYWHFVDVVWLFLFVWIYWWGSYGYVY